MTVESPPRTCPRCDSAVAADAKFCANCGQSLEGASDRDEETQARLTASAPAPLIEKMRAAKLSGERKPVTALFADAVGSTALAAPLAPDAFDVEDLGGIEVKGKAAPVHAYRTLRRRDAPGRKRGLASVGLDSPMIGRDGPLDRLAGLMPIVRAGRGRVAFLLGEPGI